MDRFKEAFKTHVQEVIKRTSKLEKADKPLKLSDDATGNDFQSALDDRLSLKRRENSYLSVAEKLEAIKL